MKFLLLVSCFLSVTVSAQGLTPVELSQGSVEGTNIRIGGEEVWPFVDGKPYPYPNAVVWDINDERVPQVVRNCMKEASEVLAKWITNPHDPLHKALLHAGKFGVPTGFFLWTNDYTQGQEWMSTRYRKAQSWNWNDSLLKWESTVDFKTQGVEVCRVPDKRETFEMINAEAQTKAQASHRTAELNPPKWETEAENPLIADPGAARLKLQ